MRTLFPATLCLIVLLLASPSGPCGPAEHEHTPSPDSSRLTEDCNGNGIDDAVDIALGDSADADLDGIPDECQGASTRSRAER